MLCIFGKYAEDLLETFSRNALTSISLYLSLSVYYVAVRTIVLSRHGSNLARPVIIHDIIHGLIYVSSTPYCGFSGVSPDENLRPTQSQSDEPSDLRGSPSPTNVYSTWQSQAVTHPKMNRARRCLTSVIEQTPMNERRIPYMLVALVIKGLII